MTTTVNPEYKLAKNNTNLDHIPGSFGIPIIGQTFQLVNDLYGTIDNQYKKFGNVLGLVVPTDDYPTFLLGYRDQINTARAGLGLGSDCRRQFSDCIKAVPGGDGIEIAPAILYWK